MLLLATMIFACSPPPESGPTKVQSADVQESPDAETLADIEEKTEEDIRSADTSTQQSDTEAQAKPDIIFIGPEEDDSSGSEEEEGWECEDESGPGCPCEENGDCETAWCVPTGEGKVCTSACVDECPEGWLCAGVSNAGSDVTFICVPKHSNLCRPCNSGTDCAQLGNTGGLCVDFGGDQGSFCASNCSSNLDCPADYICEERSSEEGTKKKQCVPADGVCPCNSKATEEAASTSCTLENEWGACDGARICASDGLSSCDAQVPVAELCNGKDDNCDAIVDDVEDQSCQVTNGFGTCSGTQSCAGGKWGECSALIPAGESCDGVDNDCDASMDEGFSNIDGDGLADCVDPDDDGDDILDSEDNCPEEANPDQSDLDGDTLGDVCDPDMDGDGALNGDDCDPYDWSFTCTIFYYDGDGDGAALCGVTQCLCEAEGAFTEPTCPAQDCDDTRPLVGPGFEEICDFIDNDCDLDIDEGAPDNDLDGIADACDVDDDADGVIDTEDNCPLTGNPQQKDCDEDGSGDLCDDDDDNDGTLDALDCAPCDPSIHPNAIDSCNARNDDCDESTDEDCFYSLHGYAVGNGYTMNGQTTGLKITHSIGSTGFVGTTSNETFTLKPVWPAGGEP